MNNELLAKVIFTNKLATKEQIHEYWPQVNASNDIAKVLIQAGILPEGYYQQLVQYVEKLDQQNSPSEASPAPAPETPVTAESTPEPTSEPASETTTQESDEVAIAEETDTAEESGLSDYHDDDSEIKDEASDTIEGVYDTPAQDDYGIETLGDLASNDIFYGKSEYLEDVTTDDLLVQTSYSDELTDRLLKSNSVVVDGADESEATTVEKDSPSPETHSTSSQTSKHSEEEFDESEGELPSAFHGQRGEGQLGFEKIHQVSNSHSLYQILELARRSGASDVHLSVNNPVIFRQFSRLVSMSESKLTQAELEAMILKDINREDLSQFLETGDFETVITIPGAGRYRATFMAQRSGWDFAARVVANEVMSMEQLGLPDSCSGLTKWAQGLVLVTGPVGCGKTTTLATLVQMVNESRKDHIITVESPVELVYPESSCQMTQREVGMHTLSPAHALKGALRQDPDILVVSELRDLETIELAVSAAETGHLVFGTMNTTNASRTITRIVDSFPPDEQEIIRSMISESLRGVISQQMLPLKDGSGVIPAFEVLIVTPPVANLIRKNEIHQLESAMITGKSSGMVLLDESMQQLIDDGLVEGKECYYRANNPKNFEKYLNQEGGE